LEGNTSEAIQQFEQAERHYAEDGRELEVAVCRYWLAIAYHKSGNRSASIEKLKTVLDGQRQLAHAILVAVHQTRELPVGFQSDPEVRRVAGDLFTRAGRLSMKIPVVRRQLRRQAQVIQVPAPYLSIQALGNVVVSIGGKPLVSSDWQTQSVRDLFIFFLNTRKPMTKDQIGEALWPDKYEPAQLKLRFKNEIYRLRRAVGQETIQFDGVFYSFDRNMDYEYDVDAFEAYLSRARSSGNINEQIEFYQKAVDLVRGPYMDDMDMDWAIPERERLNQIYLSALLSLADLFLQQSNTEKSLAVSQRAVAYDATYEPAYRKIMQIYYRMGDRAAVLRTYQACQEAMQKQLDMRPSIETEELYRNLNT
jgi:two-component SAPR family response regulator